MLPISDTTHNTVINGALTLADVDTKLKKQIEISKQRIAMKYKVSIVNDNTSCYYLLQKDSPLKSLENSMLEEKLLRKRRTPHKELPDPTKGQSTPVKKATNDDPFGFDVLDSPLVFSPVLPSNYTSNSHLQVSSEHNSQVVKRRSFGTYDIPFKNGPHHGRDKKKKKRNSQVSMVVICQ